MTVLKSCRLRSGNWTGTTSTGVAEYSVTWVVTTDDEDDGPEVVAAAVPGVIGADTYAEGNDSDDKSILLRKVPRREGPKVWYVSLEYGDPARQNENTKPDEEGNETTDPLRWRDEYSQSQTIIQVPVEEGWNVNALNRALIGEWRAANTKGALQNSAGGAFDPEPVQDLTLMIWNVRMYRNDYDEVNIAPFRDTINQAPVVLAVPQYGTSVYFRETYDTHTMLCASAIASYPRVNNVDVWVHDYQFIHNPRKWYERPIDRGWNMSADDGGPDNTQRGATINPLDRAEAAAPVQNNRDHHGEPVLELVNFDLAGLPLGQGQVPRRIEYRTREEADFESPLLPVPFLAAP